MPSQPFASPRPMPSFASTPLPRRVRETLQDVLALVFDHVIGPLERVLDDLERQLQRAAEHADDFSERMRRLAQVRAVQRHRDRLGPRFIELLEAELASIRTPPAPAEPQAAGTPPGGKWELRLLEDDEASEDALLRAITMRYESRAGLPLQLLGQRFGVLGARPAFDAEQLPVGPHRLTELLSAACDVFEIAPETRLQLLHLFERRVLASYEELAIVLNDTLAARNVLPSMKFVPLRARPRLRDAGGEALPAAEPAPAAVAGPGVAAGDPGASFDFVQQLLVRRRGLIERLRAGGGPVRTGGTLVPTAHVVAALAPLQGQPIADLDRVRDELQERFIASGAGVLAPDDADVFELVGLLHARINEQLRADSPSATLVSRLLIPLLRVALRDHDIFNQPHHPARQLLDAVAAPGRPGTAEDDIDPQLRATLERAVAEVVEHYRDDLRVFEEANATVQEQLRAVARKSEVAERRQIEAARGKERLAEARRRAADLIAGLAHEHELPRATRSLMNLAWADVLTLSLLRHDEESEEWTSQLETTRQIVAVAAGAPAPEGLDARIRDALTRIGYHDDEAAAIARHLGIGETVDDDAAATRTELAMRLKSRARLGTQALPDTPPLPPRTPAEQARLEELRTLHADGWFEFDGADGAPVRRRLAWIGPASDSALFVNRRGQRAVELTLDELARLLERGAVRPVVEDNRGVVERAWQATLASLRGFGAEGTGP